jgi:hypothetical protein
MPVACLVNALLLINHILVGLDEVFGVSITQITNYLEPIVVRQSYLQNLAHTGIQLADAILITLYTSSLFYSHLNTSMYTNQIHNSSIPYITELTRVLNLLPDFTGPIYRGVNTRPILNRSLTNNVYLQSPSFSSFSTHLAVSNNFGGFCTLFSQSCGKLIENFSIMPEGEVLILPNTVVQIHQVQLFHPFGSVNLPTFIVPDTLVPAPPLVVVPVPPQVVVPVPPQVVVPVPPQVVVPVPPQVVVPVPPQVVVPVPPLVVVPVPPRTLVPVPPLVAG